jgi:hypothetical protein
LSRAAAIVDPEPAKGQTGETHGTVATAFRAIVADARDKKEIRIKPLKSLSFGSKE